MAHLFSCAEILTSVACCCGICSHRHCMAFGIRQHVCSQRSKGWLSNLGERILEACLFLSVIHTVKLFTSLQLRILFCISGGYTVGVIYKYCSSNHWLKTSILCSCSPSVGFVMSYFRSCIPPEVCASQTDAVDSSLCMLITLLNTTHCWDATVGSNVCSLFDEHASYA